MSDKEEPPASPDPPDEEPNEENESQQNISASNPELSSETTSRGSSRRYASKIVAPSPRRVPDGSVTPPTKTSPSSTTMGVCRNDAMYERSKLHLAIKELRLKETEKKLMEECTFTPETNRSRTSSKSGTSPVFDRLYSESRKSTPKKYNGRQSGDSQKRSPTSVSSHGSSRIEYLYQDGLRRAHNRKLTDKEEAEARRRRLEEKELQLCTFRPNMDWRKKKPPVRVNGKHKDSVNIDSPQYQYSPPVHVVTTRSISARHVGRHKSDQSHSIVSPLRGPDIPSRAAVPSGIESLGDDTEYGSI